MDMHDLAHFVEMSNRVQELLGNVSIKAPISTEGISEKTLVEALYWLKTCLRVLCEGDITYKRPGTGISPYIGMRLLGETM